MSIRAPPLTDCISCKSINPNLKKNNGGSYDHNSKG